MIQSANVSIYWFIPSSGDGRYLGTAEGARGTEFRYLAAIAQAADTLGFDGVLIPTGQWCLEGWVLASALAPLTERLRFLVAVRPGLMAPGQAARMAATLDQVSTGRLALNVVTGGDPQELARDGLFLPHDERYELTDEWLTVFRGVLAGEEVDFAGRHIRARGARLLYPPEQIPYPPIYFGGSSPAAVRVAARHADVYLTWGEPVDWVREKLAAVRQAAEATGRKVRFGLRVHVVVRETEAQAWEAAEELIRRADPQAIARAQETFAAMDSVGQKRMVALHGGVYDPERLRVGRHLWAGVGLVRGGAGTALVGDPQQVAAALAEYAALGIDTFILSGYPHLEEAYRVAELLFPLLGRTATVFSGRKIEAFGHSPARR